MLSVRFKVWLFRVYAMRVGQKSTPIHRHTDDVRGGTKRVRTGPEQQLWWLAQEIRDAADAIGPAPVEAERSLRVLADQAERLEVEPWGGL